MKSSDIKAVLLCAGLGSRAGLGYNKVFYMLNSGRTVFETALKAIKDAGIDDIVVAVAASDEKRLKTLYDGRYVLGGETRTQSVRNALEDIRRRGGCKIVVIHDAARPFAPPRLFEAAAASAAARGSGVAAVKSVDTVREAENDVVTGAPARDKLYNVQTPQAFDFDKLYEAYRGAAPATDDSEIYLNAGHRVYLTAGDYANVKLTAPSDFSGRRVGNGFDVHRLEAGRPLILGGVTIPHYKGLAGHSDADVLTHAVMDALLSAAGLKDIGTRFPDNDAVYLGADSLLLLGEVIGAVRESGFRVVNVTAAIMAQKPRLALYIDAMREKLARQMRIDNGAVSITATTTENLGIIGEERGLAAWAVCLLERL